jgi:hypothetical protein
MPTPRPLLVLLALTTACGAVDDRPAADAPPGTPDAAADAAIDAPPPPPDASTDGPPAVPMISEFLAPQCGAYTPASGVGAGDDLHKVTLTNPDAVCNDGTRAVLYVRASTGGANANRWVFYQQGGGGCGTGPSCAIRYCGTQKYTKAKMSSRWTPMVANTDDQGLFDRDGINPFGEANSVLMYYCSSDSWTGTKSDTILDNPNDPTQRYRIHFRGHTIVQAALDQLLAGPVTSDDGAVTLPRLTAANLVVWSGTSAGGAGAEFNLDYVAGRLTPNGTQVRGVFDANLPPRSSDIDPAIAAQVDGQAQTMGWPVVQTGNWGMYADQSCLAMHAPADQWMCGDNTHVVMNHITTPFIARQDLRDTTIGGTYLDLGVPLATLATWYRATALAVPDIQSTAEERAAITTRPGIYAPNCNQHVALTSKDYFQITTLTPPGGQPLTWRGAITAWLTGTAITAIDTQPATLSVCAGMIDNGE